MKKKLSFLAFCLITTILCITACTPPSNSGGSEDQEITLQFSVDSSLNGTFKSCSPSGFENIYFITLTDNGKWEFGQNSTASITDNSSKTSISKPVSISFYKGTYEKKDNELVLTKTHVTNGLLNWKEDKVENWKTARLNADKTKLNITFTAADLTPGTSNKEKKDENSADDSKLKNSIVFAVKEIYDSRRLNGNCDSLTVNNAASAKYYMEFKDNWSASTWELGINETDSKGSKIQAPLYKGTFENKADSIIIDLSGSYTKEIELSITHIYEVNEWIDYKVNNWRKGTFNSDEDKLTFKFSDEDLVSHSEEILKNNALVENEIKAITESSVYVLTKRCKLSAVKKGLDYLKQNNPDIKIDLDLSQYTGLAISDNAFSNCTNLKSVIFSEKLLSIGKSAFEDCSSLEKISISKGLTTVDSSAFEACSNLTSVYFKGSIDDWCKNDWFAKSRASYYSFNGFFPAGYDLYLDDKLQTEITIPDTAKKINAYLFTNCKSLTKVKLSESVTQVAYGAFKGCSNLTSVEIPSSVISISNNSFENCTKLENVYYKGSLRRWCTASSSSYSTDAESKSWNASVFPAAYDLYIDNKKITELNADSLKSITSLCDYAFKNCKSLTTVNIPDTVTSFGSSSYSGNNNFKGCSNLTSVTVGQNALKNFSSTFDKDFVKDVVIRNGASAIDYSAFYYFSKLESITIPASVKSIDSYTFHYCNALSRVNYGGTLEQWCTANYSSSNSDSNENNDAKSWTASIFYSAYDLYIGDQKITEFSTASLKEDIEICASAFKNCKSLTSVSVNQKYLEKFKDIFDSKYITNVVILDGVTSIGCGYQANIFENFTNLTSVTISASVTKIYTKAFYTCSSLTKIIFEDTTSKWYKVSSSYGYNSSYKESENNKPMSAEPEKNAKLLVPGSYYDALYYISEKYTSN